MRTLLFFGLLAPAVILAIRSQFFALLVYIVFGLSGIEQKVWTDLSAMRISLILGILVAVPHDSKFRGTHGVDPDENPLASYGLPNITHPLSIGAVLFLGTALVAQLYAVAPAVGWYWLDYLWRVLLTALLATSLVSSERRLYWTLVAVGGAIAINSAKAGLYSLLSGGVRFDNGLMGAFSDNNGYALAIVMALPLMVAAAQNARHRSLRWAFWAAVPTSMYTILSTYSRGGFLGMAVIAVVFLALQRRRALALMLLGVMVAIALIIVPVPQDYLKRLETIGTYEQVDESSAISRLHFWRVALVIASENPLGIGLFNYEAAYDRYDTSGGIYGQKRAVHSSHFQVLAEQGYPGLLIWIGCFVIAFRAAFRARARSRDPNRSSDSQRLLFTGANALIVSMTGFLVSGAFLAAALNDLTWLTFGLVAALDRLSKVPVKTAAPAASEAPIVPTGERFTGSYRRASEASAMSEPTT
jgi:putative inorganic carbon (HCO3(-)) transporter